jgi:hypothetical protein
MKLRVILCLNFVHFSFTVIFLIYLDEISNEYLRKNFQILDDIQSVKKLPLKSVWQNVTIKAEFYLGYIIISGLNNFFESFDRILKHTSQFTKENYI